MRSIKEGDIVFVHYVNGDILKDVVVEHTPADVGDLWYFSDDDGIIYAQNPVSANLDTIIKMPFES